MVQFDDYYTCTQLMAAIREEQIVRFQTYHTNSTIFSPAQSVNSTVQHVLQVHV
jgi:hypothetical protein